MLHQWRFVASLGLDALGFIAQLVALHRLPLFAVQAMIAANLAVTAVCATWLVGAVLHWREWVAVVGVVTGWGCSAARPARRARRRRARCSSSPSSPRSPAWACSGLAAGRLPDRFRTPVLGVVAGTGYGVLGIAARVLNGFAPLTLIRDPATYALIAAGIVSFLSTRRRWKAAASPWPRPRSCWPRRYRRLRWASCSSATGPGPVSAAWPSPASCWRCAARSPWPGSASGRERPAPGRGGEPAAQLAGRAGA